MKLTVNKTNVTPAGGAYPYGNIKNDDGTFNGTPINVELLSDYVQFFEKMFAESGLVANGNPDNSTSGFQLWEALKAIAPILQVEPLLEFSLFAEMEAIEFPSGIYSYNPKATINEFDLSDAFGGFGSKLVTFSNALPLGTELTFIRRTGSTDLPIILNSTEITSGEPTITMEGVLGADTAFSLVVEKLYKVIRLTDGWRIKEI